MKSSQLMLATMVAMFALLCAGQLSATIGAMGAGQFGVMTAATPTTTAARSTTPVAAASTSTTAVTTASSSTATSRTGVVAVPATSMPWPQPGGSKSPTFVTSCTCPAAQTPAFGSWYQVIGQAVPSFGAVTFPTNFNSFLGGPSVTNNKVFNNNNGFFSVQQSGVYQISYGIAPDTTSLAALCLVDVAAASLLTPPACAAADLVASTTVVLFPQAQLRVNVVEIFLNGIGDSSTPSVLSLVSANTALIGLIGAPVLSASITFEQLSGYTSPTTCACTTTEST